MFACRPYASIIPTLYPFKGRSMTLAACLGASMDIKWVLAGGMEQLATIRAEWVATIGLVFWCIWKLYGLWRRPMDLPPGPPTVPILGNLPAMPKKFTFLQMTSWAREYGEIYSLMNGPNKTVVVLTSPKAIYDILERQTLATADRPQTVIINSITGGMTIGTSNHNRRWRSSRRLVTEALSPQACARYLLLHTAEANQVMFDILRAPEETYRHIRRFSASVILSTMYGQRTPQFTSAFIQEFLDLNQKNAKVQSLTSARLLQIFPILRYVPERLASWKTACREVRNDMRKTLFGLLGEVEERVRQGGSNGCHSETMLDMADRLKLSREEIAFLGWSMLAPGSSTTSSWLQIFILCITAHPEVQVKAQKELDEVVGTDRIPQLKDLGSLPYVQAVIREVSRFRPHLPMTFSHVSTADVMYGNYRIPSGSTILGNIWGVFRDEKLFDNPDSFDPERFMTSPLGLRADVDIEAEPALKMLNSLPWGCGRRACPGVHLSQQTIAINVMNILWAFNFNKPRNPDDGTELEIDLWAFDCHSIVHVHPFTLNPVVRNKARAEIIKANYLASLEVFEDYERELDEEDRQYVTRMRKEAADS